MADRDPHSVNKSHPPRALYRSLIFVACVKPAGEKPTATLPSPSSVSPDPNGAAAPPTAKQQEEAPPVGAKMEEEAIAARRSRKTPEMLSEELRTAPVPRPLIARDVPPPKELKKPAAPVSLSFFFQVCACAYVVHTHLGSRSGKRIPYTFIYDF